MKQLTVGIDPDIEKSGVAVFHKDKKYLELTTLKFFDLQDFLKKYREDIEVVKIEAAWLIKKSNWHSKQGIGAASKIGKNVGANHETGRKIAEMCEYLQIPYRLIKPLKKVWKSGKISHSEFNQQLKFRGIPEIIGRTSQDMRDAGLICLYG